MGHDHVMILLWKSMAHTGRTRHKLDGRIVCEPMCWESMFLAQSLSVLKALAQWSEKGTARLPWT